MNEVLASFLSHLEALRQALWRMIAAIALLLIPGFLLAKPVIAWLTAYAFPAGITLNYFTPMEPLLVELKVGLMLAIIGAMPVILWQGARFFGPALYEHERRVALRSIGAALFLFLAGAALNLFLVAPMIMRFSAGMETETLRSTLGLGTVINLITLMTLAFGLMFQLPVIMVFLVRCGIVNVTTLRKSRPVVVVVIFFLAALLTPPDIVSQLMLGVPTWLLFEIALVIAGRCGRPPAAEEITGTENAKTDGVSERNGPVGRKTAPQIPADRQTPEDRLMEPQRSLTGGPGQSPVMAAENAVDSDYEDPYCRKWPKKRRFRAINGHYRAKRKDKK